MIELIIVGGIIGLVVIAIIASIYFNSKWKDRD